MATPSGTPTPTRADVDQHGPQATVSHDWHFMLGSYTYPPLRYVFQVVTYHFLSLLLNPFDESQIKKQLYGILGLERSLHLRSLCHHAE
jgi:hypothetical protein